jgi:arsenate reductase
MELPIRVLFLCTGNSCRSIMAEAMANHLGEGRLRAHSAGSHPTGLVNPHALAVLREHDVPPGEPASRSWDEFEATPLDLVITVCDAAAGESCPLWLSETPKAYWGLPDPAMVEGSPATIAAAFEKTYHRIRRGLESLLALPLAELTPAQLTAALGDIQRRVQDG